MKMKVKIKKFIDFYETYQVDKEKELKVKNAVMMEELLKVTK